MSEIILAYSKCLYIGYGVRYIKYVNYLYFVSKYVPNNVRHISLLI